MPKYLLLLAIVLLFGSCTNSYYMTGASLTEQLGKIQDPGQKIKQGNGIVFSLLGGNAYYNQLTKLECIDKKGNKVIMTVNDQTQVRVYDKKEETKTLFFFDSMYLKDSCVCGLRSRIFRISAKVPCAEISKVKVISPASQIIKN